MTGQLNRTLFERFLDSKLAFKSVYTRLYSAVIEYLRTSFTLISRQNYLFSPKLDNVIQLKILQWVSYKGIITKTTIR